MHHLLFVYLLSCYCSLPFFISLWYMPFKKYFAVIYIAFFRKFSTLKILIQIFRIIFTYLPLNFNQNLNYAFKYDMKYFTLFLPSLISSPLPTFHVKIIRVFLFRVFCCCSVTHHIYLFNFIFPFWSPSPNSPNPISNLLWQLPIYSLSLSLFFCLFVFIFHI